MLTAEGTEVTSNYQLKKSTGQVIYRSNHRLRINVVPHLENIEYGNQLKQKIELLQFVSNVRINPVAKSIAIEYNADGIDLNLIEEKILSCIEQVDLSEIFLNSTVEPLGLNQTVHTVGYEVIHRNPQRLRVRIPRLGNDPDYGGRLNYLMRSIAGVVEFRINLAARCISVEFDTPARLIEQQHQLFETIEQAPYVSLDQKLVNEPVKKSQSKEIDYWERLGLPVASLIISTAVLLGLPLPGILTGALILTASLPVFQRAWDAIEKDRQLTIDFLDGLAIGLHTAQGSYFAPSLMLGLIEGGEVIRDMTARGSERASFNLLDCLNTYALVERDGQEVQILAKEIIEGDHVIVYPGDQIPVDGYILRGTALIDQCKLTGESVPVTRTQGDEVFASTLVVDGNICILAERIGNNTRAGVILALVESAPVHDTRMENYAAMIANQMVVPTLFIAAGVGVANFDLNRAIALLTLDLGTGIRMSVPTTILSALTYAARNGVFIRSGRAMEILAKIDTVVFDKTGTLTQGHAGINDIKLMDESVSANELLALAATAEQGLTHPVADAIVRHARNLQVPIYSCESWEYQVGLGVSATINGKNILVGSHRLMNKSGISLDILNQRYPDLKSGSNSLVYVASNGTLIGVILYSDPPRAESKSVMRELQREGIQTYMLSGDVTRVAKAIAKELGIPQQNIYAEAFPERKVEVVKELHDTGKTVAFCGDGINDSAALAYADVSISFAGATDIARETADVVLMENDLRGLTHAIKIAKQAMQIVWENTAMVAIPNVGALAAGILFTLDPILAIIINNGSAILAELNGLRPLMGPGGVTSLSSSLSGEALLEEDLRLHSSHQEKPDPEQKSPNRELENGSVPNLA